MVLILNREHNSCVCESNSVGQLDEYIRNRHWTQSTTSGNPLGYTMFFFDWNFLSLLQYKCWHVIFASQSLIKGFTDFTQWDEIWVQHSLSFSSSLVLIQLLKKKYLALLYLSAVWCWADSVQWVYQSLFVEKRCLLLLEIRLMRALRLDHQVNVS